MGQGQIDMTQAHHGFLGAAGTAAVPLYTRTLTAIAQRLAATQAKKLLIWTPGKSIAAQIAVCVHLGEH